MADRAHIRSGSVIAKYASEKGWLVLENGQKASPVIIGFVDGNDMVVPIVDELVDNSTGPDTVTEVTIPWAIQTTPDRYYRQRTKRDMTAQELADKDTNEQANLRDLIRNELGFKQINSIMYRIAKGTIPPTAVVSKSAWNTWVDDAFIKTDG